MKLGLFSFTATQIPYDFREMKWLSKKKRKKKEATLTNPVPEIRYHYAKVNQRPESLDRYRLIFGYKCPQIR